LEKKTVEMLKQLMTQRNITHQTGNKQELIERILKFDKRMQNPTRLKDKIDYITIPTLEKSKHGEPVLSKHYSASFNGVDRFDAQLATIKYNYKTVNPEFIWFLALIRFAAVNSHVIYLDSGLITERQLQNTLTVFVKNLSPTFS